MVAILINGCSDKLSETTFMGDFMENNKGLLNQPEDLEDLVRSKPWYNPPCFLVTSQFMVLTIDGSS